MAEQQIKIINKLGLHARAAAKLVKTAGGFVSTISLTYGNQQADAKSIMSVMMLAAAQGSVITINCQGEDEDSALSALINLINDYFGEDE